MENNEWRPQNINKCMSIFPEDIDEECAQNCKGIFLCSMAKTMSIWDMSAEERERRRKLTPAQEIAEMLDNIEKNTFHSKTATKEDVDEILEKTQEIRTKLKTINLDKETSNDTND